LATAFGVLHLEEDVGASIDAGGIIATVAAGPLRRPIVSPVAGRLTRILGRQDQRVEYGTPLFEILEAKGLS
jgi:biotin carboxyl carrier protein